MNVYKNEQIAIIEITHTVHVFMRMNLCMSITYCGWKIQTKCTILSGSNNIIIKFKDKSNSYLMWIWNLP